MNLLKAIRAFRGLSQETLAKEVGKSQSWISRVESGKLLPEREQAQRVAKALGTNAERLFETYRLC